MRKLKKWWLRKLKYSWVNKYFFDIAPDLKQPFKSLGYRPITPEDEALLKISVEHSLDFLENAVIKARGERLKPGILEEIDDARFISVETAKEFGLIDEVGTYVVAVEEALRLAGLYRERTTIIEYENGAEKIAPENIYLH